MTPALRQYQARLDGLDPRPRRHEYRGDGGQCRTCGLSRRLHLAWWRRVLEWIGGGA